MEEKAHQPTLESVEEKAHQPTLESVSVTASAQTTAEALTNSWKLEARAAAVVVRMLVGALAKVLEKAVLAKAVLEKAVLAKALAKVLEKAVLAKAVLEKAVLAKALAKISTGTAANLLPSAARLRYCFWGSLESSKKSVLFMLWLKKC